MPRPLPAMINRAATGRNLNHRGRNLRNVTGGYAPGDQPTKPGIPGPNHPQFPPHPVPTGTNAQGYDPIHYGQNNNRIGYAKVGQARNQPGGVPAPGAPAPAPSGGGLTGLALALSQGRLPDRFKGGFSLGENLGKINDTTVGVSSAQHAAQYQKLFNAAQAAGLNITGGTGSGGAYDPLNLYARGGNHNDYVDLTTGRINGPSTGGSGNEWAGVSPEVLARLQANSGWTAERAAGTTNKGNPTTVETREQFIANGGTPTGGNAPNPATGPTSPQGTGGAVVASPESAFGAGRDPGKHAAYWADKGWHQNPATGVWHGPKGETWDQTPNDKPKPGQGGGGAGGPVNDPNGPQSPGAGGTPTGNLGGMATGASSQLPLDPTFEMGRAGAQSQLTNALSNINAQQGQLTAEQQLAQARMDTNRGVDIQQLLEAMAGRGTMNSSIYGDNRELLGTDYARQEQDLGISVANAMAGLAGASGNAYTDYDQALIQLLMESADRSNDQYAPVDQGPAAPRRGRGRRGRRGRGRR